jgi:hypothetical protein
VTTRVRGGRGRGELIAWSLIAILFAAPMATAITGAALLASAQSRGSATEAAVFAQVSREGFVDSQAVTVTLTWADGIGLRAPAWGGLITETGVGPGDVVRAGSRIARVDGVWRVAAPTPMPFHTSVGWASPAAEVKAVNALLRAMGFDAPGDAWSWSTTVALREFAAGIGIRHSDAVSELDPAWLVWSPAPEVTVASVPLRVGTAAPGQGEEVLTGPPRLTGVVVAAEEGAILPTSDADPSADADDDGPDDEWVLRVGDATLPYSSAQMTADLAGSELERALSQSRPAEVKGLIERATAVEGWQVPVSAVHTDTGGAQCVFRRDRSASGFAAVRVAVQRGAIGTARVDGPLKAEDEILVNPSAVAGDAECG